MRWGSMGLMLRGGSFIGDLIGGKGRLFGAGVVRFRRGVVHCVVLEGLVYIDGIIFWAQLRA